MTRTHIYKTALITGASSGIGAEMAKQLSSSGVKVIAVARSKAKLAALKKSLPTDAQKLFIPLAKDLTSRTDIESVITYVDQEDPIDLLVNNAGVGFSKKFEQLTAEEIDATIHTNLFGSIYLTQGILRARDTSRPLHLVFVTSLAGKVGFGDLSVYSATKFALEGFSEALRNEYIGTNVSITVLRPGITDTDFFAKAGMDDFRESVKDEKSFFTPEKVASEFIAKVPEKPPSIIVGNDRYFLLILPFIPFKYRFTILNLINKL